MIKNIRPLPISEEKLGAYIEGNLSQSDALYIEELIKTDSILRDFVDEVSLEDVDTGVTVYDENPNFDNDFILPEIPINTDNFEMIQFDPFDSDSSLHMVASVACADIDDSSLNDSEALDDLQHPIVEDDGVIDFSDGDNSIVDNSIDMSDINVIDYE